MNASSGDDQLLALDLRLRCAEWDSEQPAVRLFPWAVEGQGDAAPRSVVIDPRVGFGRPALLGTGIPTAVVASRFWAGEPLTSIAEGYRVGADRVEDPIRRRSVRPPEHGSHGSWIA